MFLFFKINYKFLEKYSFYFFVGSIILTALVFIPSIGWGHQGAGRWVNIGFISFQPVEFLKFSFIIYFATWLTLFKNKIKDMKYNLIALTILLASTVLILFNQPDTKSLILILATGIAMFFISGIPVKLKYILGAIAGLIFIFGSFIFFNPYIQQRIKTFLDPSQDPLGSSYQIQQSLISFGSGKILGRGYGQSIQKFNYLPEAQGDSIFAVIGEEFGFIGSVGIIILYLLFALRGFNIANHAPSLFSGLLVSGIIIIIITQSFMNIASITGIFPLTGVPLVFVSHGGTSLMVYLAAIGIILQISKLKIKL